MSCQRGNLTKKAQKHKNMRTFKNDVHDTSQKMKMLNKLEVQGVCNRCKQIIEWKIKYKKYKLLSVPKKCTKCQEKKIKFAYRVVCDSCAEKCGCCAKCGQDIDLSETASQSSLPPEECTNERNDKCNNSLEDLSQSVLPSVALDKSPVIDSLSKLTMCKESATDKVTLCRESLAGDDKKEILCAESATVFPDIIYLTSPEES